MRNVWNMIEMHTRIQRAIIETERERFSDAAGILDAYESHRKTDEDEQEAHQAKTLLEGAAVAACEQKLKERQECLATAKKQMREVKATDARLVREKQAHAALFRAHALEHKPEPTPDQLADAAKSAKSFIQCGPKAPMIGITRKLEQKVPHSELG